MESLLRTIQSLRLTDYVSYHVSEEELVTFGLDDPELTTTVEYCTMDSDGNSEESGTLVLHLSRNPEELAAYEQAVEKEKDDLPEVPCYVRLDQSQIVYQISQSVYDQLTEVSYDKLRHQKLFTTDFDTVTSIDVSLNGESYPFVCHPPEDQEDEDAESTWTYNDEEFDIAAVKTSLCAISATEFTEETASGQEEISLTLHLEDEDFPTFTLTLCRFDGSNCTATVDGKPIALVSRVQTVNLIEAVNKLTLGS